MGLRLQPCMPEVASARVGSLVGTGVPAREKSRMPAAATPKPMTIKEPPTTQRTVLPPATANGTGSTRSATMPSTRAERNRMGGRAMTPATAVLLACRPSDIAVILGQLEERHLGTDVESNRQRVPDATTDVKLPVPGQLEFTGGVTPIPNRQHRRRKKRRLALTAVRV